MRSSLTPITPDRDLAVTSPMNVVLAILLGWQVLVFVAFSLPPLFAIGIDQIFWIQARTLIPSALERFHQDIGRYPTTAEGIDALRVAPKKCAGQWKGPYLEGTLRPTFGETYFYEAPGSHSGHNYDFWIGYHDRVFASWLTPPTPLSERFLFRYSGFLGCACYLFGYLAWRYFKKPIQPPDPKPID